MSHLGLLRHVLAALVLIVALPLMLAAAALLGHGQALWRAFTASFRRAFRVARDASTPADAALPIPPAPVTRTTPAVVISDELAALIVQREEPYVRAGMRRRH